MSNPRYLTKSRFKLGMECPTKLFYTKKKEYLDSKMDDAFLAALTEGGFQVGELAKYYHPGGHDITTLDYEEAERQTNELLKQDEVIIYEPAIRFNNLFIRIDVLVKNGNHFELIEVKAKSFDPEEDTFLNKNGTISAGWQPYLHDIAFQKHVLASKFPNAKIDSYLMMADKTSECPVDGLNQKFRIVRDDSNRKGCKVSHTLSEDDLKSQILCKVQVDDIIDMIMEDGTFLENIDCLATAYEKDEKIVSPIGSHCAGCEFDCDSSDEGQGYKSGFKECWKAALDWNDTDFEDPNVLEVWSFSRKNQLIADGRIKLSDLTIDFETSMVAIPFNKGRRPYEAIAFQFSHHTVYADGRVEHSGEFLNTNVGEFPNYEFLREFKRQLEGDEGTIFRYSPHENTFLNHIYRQLREDESDIPDREELCEFIKTITTSSSSMAEKWEGDRNMVDLWHLVKRYYYDPATRGSNSIKAVLPAILNSSDFLQEKYGKPIYGTDIGIKSLNFKDWQWLEIKDGKVVDPYKKLPKMFTDVSDKNLEILTEDDELANGGAALTAYGRMQFSEMNEVERNELSSALLRYCELDTLAMAMIFEAWKSWVYK